MTRGDIGPAPEVIALRPECEADEAFLTRLYIAGRWDEFAAACGLSREQKITLLTNQSRLQSLHYATHYAGSDFLILEQGDIPIGRLCVDRRQPAGLRIVDVSLLPEWRNRGIGTAFLRALLAEAAAQNRTASLHVENANPARRLYQRLGFRPIELRGPYCYMECDASASGADR